MKTQITITDGTSTETWTTLTELCRVKQISYHYLKRQKLPFKYRGVLFERKPTEPVNVEKGIKFNKK